VVGLLVGGILCFTGYLFGLFLHEPWFSGAAMLMVVVEILITRGLHLDGLADWADSVGGATEKEKRLAIMKDTSLGTFGVLALVVVLLAKWIAFERLLSLGAIVWIPPIFLLSRDRMVALITTLPYARDTGGMGKPFVNHASTHKRITAHVISLLLCLPFGPICLGLFAVAWMQTWLFGSRCRKHFGGITGDLLGTANEMVQVSLLMICAFLGKHTLSWLGWSWLLSGETPLP
jgi:adenosylcobinamide-GDP ribazoletransferase